MAKIELSSPPALPKEAVYGEYLPWLLQNFYWRICAYCLCSHVSLTIDHFVPQSFDGSRANDPKNLLPACMACNRSKSDYHPKHLKRRRLSSDTSGYLPIDARAEDLASFFELQPNGELHAHNPATAERAAWHATVLLKLDLEPWRNSRQTIHAMAVAARDLLHSRAPDSERGPVLAVLIDYLAKNSLLLDALNFDFGADLKDAVAARRKDLVAQEAA